MKTTQLPNAPNPLNRSLHAHDHPPLSDDEFAYTALVNRAPPPPLSKRREGIEPRLASPRLGSPRLGSARLGSGETRPFVETVPYTRVHAQRDAVVCVVVVGRGRRREGGKKLATFITGEHAAFARREGSRRFYRRENANFSFWLDTARNASRARAPNLPLPPTTTSCVTF